MKAEINTSNMVPVALMLTPTTAPPFIVDFPICEVKDAFHPPRRIRLFVMVATATGGFSEYVPIATLMASPADAFEIAPLMVRQGAAGDAQEFVLTPVG